jgi:hypothetical protein
VFLVAKQCKQCKISQHLSKCVSIQDICMVLQFLQMYLSSLWNSTPKVFSVLTPPCTDSFSVLPLFLDTLYTPLVRLILCKSQLTTLLNFSLVYSLYVHRHRKGTLRPRRNSPIHIKSRNNTKRVHCQKK